MAGGFSSVVPLRYSFALLICVNQAAAMTWISIL